MTLGNHSSLSFWETPNLALKEELHHGRFPMEDKAAAYSREFKGKVQQPQNPTTVLNFQWGDRKWRLEKVLFGLLKLSEGKSRLC